MVKIIYKPSDNKEDTRIIFSVNRKIKKRARLICAERDISLSKFIRESLEENVKKYEKDIISI